MLLRKDRLNMKKYLFWQRGRNSGEGLKVCGGFVPLKSDRLPRTWYTLPAEVLDTSRVGVMATDDRLWEIQEVSRRLFRMPSKQLEGRQPPHNVAKDCTRGREEREARQILGGGDTAARICWTKDATPTTPKFSYIVIINTTSVGWPEHIK